jgi:hypothetical protein
MKLFKVKKNQRVRHYLIPIWQYTRRKCLLLDMIYSVLCPNKNTAFIVERILRHWVFLRCYFNTRKGFLSDTLLFVCGVLILYFLHNIKLLRLLCCSVVLREQRSRCFCTAIEKWIPNMGTSYIIYFVRRSSIIFNLY